MSQIISNHDFWLNFDKANYSFLHPFLLLEEKEFRKNATLENQQVGRGISKNA